MVPSEAEDTHPAALVRVRAFRWLADHRERFVAADDTSDKHELFARKAFVELALLVGLASRTRPRVPADAYAALLEHVASIASRRWYKELVARDRAAFTLYAATCAALRLAGRDDRELRWSIQQLEAGRFASVIERPPYRQLDLIHTLDAAEIAHELPTIESVLPFTILVADPNLVELRDRDVYAITHTVFYASDFGARPVPWPPGYDSAQAIELIDALLSLYRRDDHTDLVGELLCSLACLGAHDTPQTPAGWRYLADRQCADGRVPGPAGTVLPEVVDEDPMSHDWRLSYHTTLVAVLAGLVAEEPAQPRATPDVAARPSKAADDLERRLAKALRRAVEWMAAQASGQSLDQGIASLAAAGRAARLAGAPPQLEEALRAVVVRIDDPLATVDWASRGGEVVLAFADALHEHAIPCDALRLFLDGLVEALVDDPTVRSQAPAAVARLVNLGLLPADPDGMAEAPAPRCEAPRTDEPPLDVVARLVELTGGDPAVFDGDDADWHATAAMLAGALVDECRAYRLNRAAAVLRGLSLLNRTSHRIVRDSVEFLLCQQTLSGAFGYTASDDEDTHAADQRTWTQAVVVGLETFARATGTPGSERRCVSPQALADRA